MNDRSEYEKKRKEFQDRVEKGQDLLFRATGKAANPVNPANRDMPNKLTLDVISSEVQKSVLDEMSSQGWTNTLIVQAGLNEGMPADVSSSGEIQFQDSSQSQEGEPQSDQSFSLSEPESVRDQGDQDSSDLTESKQSPGADDERLQAQQARIQELVAKGSAESEPQQSSSPEPALETSDSMASEPVQESPSVSPGDMPSVSSLIDKGAMDAAIKANAPDPTTPEADKLVATLSEPIKTQSPELVKPKPSDGDKAEGRKAVGNRDTREPPKAELDRRRASSSDTRFRPEALDDEYGSSRFDGDAGLVDRAGAAVAGAGGLVSAMVALLDRLVASNASAHQRITELVDRVDASSELDEFDEG